MLILLLAWAGRLAAQQFEVRSFSQLKNDITAWVDPVRDLNKEACALIKVAKGKDFTFTTPLGIVKRKEEVGETWIYVPHGTIQITIKHPKWGVLRDYAFAQPLESRLTYEMTLVALPGARFRDMSPSLNVQEELSGKIRTRLVVMEKEKAKRPKEPLFRLAMLTAEAGTSSAAPGVRVGFARRHGIYLRAATNFVSSSSEWECDANGSLSDGSGTPYYRDAKHDAYVVFQLGGLHRIAGRFYLYEGIGYGSRQLIWETSEGVKVKNTDESYRGVAAEVGGMYRFGRFILSAGGSTVKGKVWAASLGFGLTF